MVDAPVSGAEWGAKAAELVFMVGGAAADLERVRPLLDVMGKAVFHLGPLGAGHAMKCLNNLSRRVNLLAAQRRRSRSASATASTRRRWSTCSNSLDRHVVDGADAPAPARHQPPASTTRSSSR